MEKVMHFCPPIKMNKITSLFIGIVLPFISGCGNKTPGHYSDYFSNYYKGAKTTAPKKSTSKSYRIKGAHYQPQDHYEYLAEGVASYYGGRDIFHGRPTSTGERFSKDGLTAAHRTLPLPCVVKVTNLENGKSVLLKVNDRGPFASTDDRIIDVSQRAAMLLGFYNKGTARVRIETCVDDSVRLAKGAPTQDYIKASPFFSFQKPAFTFANSTPAEMRKHVIRNGRGAKKDIKLAYNGKASQLLRRHHRTASKLQKTSYQKNSKISAKRQATHLHSRKGRRIT